MTDQQSSYPFQEQKIEEMVRLKRQASLVTKAMGGVLVEQHNQMHFQRVLDLACGPGEWVMAVANDDPQVVQVVGVDKSRRMIDWASAQAEVEGSRVSFRLMDITEPLTFDENSFDLVNARFIHSVLLKEQWPKLLNECYRILRPGGIIRITEQESGFTTNSIYQSYMDLWGKAWRLSEHSFSHTDAHTGITVVLKRMMTEAGFVSPLHQPISIDLSYGQPFHRAMLENLTQALKLASGFLQGVRAATQEEIDQLYEQMLGLVGREDFCAYWLLQTVWSTKPQELAIPR